MIAPRSLEDRRTAAQNRLAHAHQLWLATGGTRGPHMIPVAFVWDDGLIVTATAQQSRTITNLRETERVRLALGATDDVVMIDAEVASFVTVPEIPKLVADRYAAVSHDPRQLPGFIYIGLRPTRTQVWNGFHEFGGRTVMLDGDWLSAPVD